MKGYFAEFENVFMFLMTYFFAITKDIFKIYFKSLVFSKQNAVVLRFDIVSDKSFSVTPVFTTLMLLLFFKLSRHLNVVVLLLLIFFFLMATNALVTSQATFSSTAFPIFLIWFSHFNLMEINSTLYFRSRMSCFDDEK